jgi:hypothetical protein
MESLIQQEIVRAVLNAREKGENYKKTIKALAKEFDLSMHVVQAIVEMSATYGLERIEGEKTAGKLWQRMGYTRAIKRLEDKIYQIQADIVRLNNRLARELGMRENPWASRRLSSELEEGEPPEAQDDRPIDKGKIIIKAHEDIEPEGKGRIEELREMVDRTRNRLGKEETSEKPSLLFRDLRQVEK